MLSCNVQEIISNFIDKSTIFLSYRIADGQFVLGRKYVVSRNIKVEM